MYQVQINCENNKNNEKFEDLSDYKCKRHNFKNSGRFAVMLKNFKKNTILNFMPRSIWLLSRKN